MNQRIFGKTGRSVSEIGLGTWQLAARWGDPFDPAEARRIPETADEAGITFVDSADCITAGRARRPSARIWRSAPGASSSPPSAAAADLPPLTEAQMDAVRAVYDRYLRDTIHPQW